MKILFVIFIMSGCGVSYAQEISQTDTTKTTISPLLQPQVVNFNGPLYILDNKEISEHEMRALEVSKITSITVLKDSTSIARYGERGRRGVVIIEMSDKVPPQHKKRSTH